MTRIFVPRGSAPTSSSNRLSSSPVNQQQQQQPSGSKDDELHNEVLQENVSFDEFVQASGNSEEKVAKCDELPCEGSSSSKNQVGSDDTAVRESCLEDEIRDPTDALNQLETVHISSDGNPVSLGAGTSQIVTGSSFPPPPPIPPPKPSGASGSPRRQSSGGLNGARGGLIRKPSVWSSISMRTSPTGSRPSSPRSFGEAEGYNSADEQSPCFISSYGDAEREQLFEIEIRRVKGFEVRRMLQDGNCLFRAVADQVYGDPEAYDIVRQMCIDYMERERDHFSQFITEGFSSYCKRKRRDKVYGNNVEIQVFSEMYNRPIHIYSYSTEPINIFHGSYSTDMPPIRLSYHHGNHYNSLVDPRRLTIGAGLGFSNLQGANVDKDQVKATIKAQQDQQIENALVAEGRFYSDLELTEKEIERMVMEASRAEYLAEGKLQHGFQESSTSGAEPSSSGGMTSTSGSRAALADGRGDRLVRSEAAVLSSSVQILLSMGFGYVQVLEAYNIFGDDVDSMVCYLLETECSNSSPVSNRRSKGKATE